METWTLEDELDYLVRIERGELHEHATRDRRMRILLGYKMAMGKGNGHKWNRNEQRIIADQLRKSMRQASRMP